MNEGRDVWSGGNMAERSAEIRKSLKHGFNRYMGSELFPKKVPPTEVEIMEKELEQVQVDIEKERERRRGEVIEKEKAPEVEKAPEGNTEAPFVSGSLVDKDGTSEGAKKGWETRRKGGFKPKEEEKPGVDFNPAEEVPGLKDITPEKAHKIVEEFFDIEQQIESAKKIDRGDEEPFGALTTVFEMTEEMTDSLKGHIDEKARQELADRSARLKDFIHNPGKEMDASIDDFHGWGMEQAKRIKDEIDAHMSYTGKELATKLAGIQQAKAPAIVDFDYIDRQFKRVKKSLAVLLDEVAEKHLPARTETITKDDIEKILKDGGWDKLPLTDRAREVIEDAITKGARPVTEYTGKVLVEHAIPEEPPAFTRPKKLNVGDTVIPLSWVGVCTQGAKFDLPNVPAAAKVKKMYVGPAKVSKDSYPYGRYPSDISKVETVMEDRLWGLELEDSVKKAEDEGVNLPLMTRDTTLVLRVDALATPSGEVNTGEPARD